jgi:hypothetical protein
MKHFHDIRGCSCSRRGIQICDSFLGGGNAPEAVVGGSVSGIVVIRTPQISRGHWRLRPGHSFDAPIHS